MPTPRQYILRGPCQVQFAGQTFYSKDNVVVKLNTKTGNIITDAIGKVDERIDDYNAEITFTPDGQVTNALMVALYPFLQAGLYRGSSVFGSADVPLIIWTRDGWKHVFSCTAVTKQPQFIASAVKTAFGAVTFRAIRSNNTAWSTAGSLVNVTQAAYPGDNAYNLSNIITEAFTGLWVPTGFAVPTANVNADSDATPDVFGFAAAHPFIVGDRVVGSGFTGDTAPNGIFYVATVPSPTTMTLKTTAGAALAGNGAYISGGTFTRANGFDAAFSTQAGFTVDTNVTLDEGPDNQTDDSGLIDMSYMMSDVTCKCIPLGPTPQELLAVQNVQGGNAARGQSLAAGGRNLYLSGNGLYVKLTMAAIKTSAPVQAGATVRRVGEVQFTATYTQTAGVGNPLGAFSTAVIA